MKQQSCVNRRNEGSAYENRAKTYFLNLGYRFLAQNVAYKFGEIDLIFEQRIGSGIELVFVEVRKRTTGSSFIQARESVTFPKLRRIKIAINQYLLRYQGAAKSIRIDLVAFENDEIFHYPDFMR
jgi:putative endonuclease